MELDLDDELELLQRRGFIINKFRTEDIGVNLHLNPCWADAFWRRRAKHSNRSDPEITVLRRISKDQNIWENVLEIGSGYGRVTNKLRTLSEIDNVIGIEICKAFQPFAEQYLKNHQSTGTDTLANVSYVFDNVMETNQLEPGSFDLIILPMNTLPSFTLEKLPLLFRSVKRLLKPDGIFIFSTYPEIDVKHNENYTGELAIDPEDPTAIPLAIEYLTMEDKERVWGLESITYSKYTYLNEQYPEQTRYFRTSRSITRHKEIIKRLKMEKLEPIIQEQVEHSFVIVTKVQ